MKYQQHKKALVLLADGTIFYGKSIGIEGTSTGEICFNTGMTGYQEIFTDPSYFGQLMVATNAHIGNYGVNAEDELIKFPVERPSLTTDKQADKVRSSFNHLISYASHKFIT